MYDYVIFIMLASRGENSDTNLEDSRKKKILQELSTTWYIWNKKNYTTSLSIYSFLNPKVSQTGVRN